VTTPSDEFPFRNTRTAAHFDAAVVDRRNIPYAMTRLLADARQDADPVLRGHARQAIAELMVRHVVGAESWIDSSVLPEDATEPFTAPMPDAVAPPRG
jgi:hypothetical protein